MSEARKALDWHCGPAEITTARYTWLRFDEVSAEQPPRFFAGTMTRFDSMQIAALDSDGALHIREYPASAAVPLFGRIEYEVELPAVPAQIRSYIVAIEGSHSVNSASEATLLRDSDRMADTEAALLVAIIAGMLLMPFLFDILFFMVLRERFVLLHAGISFSSLVWVAMTGGVITALVSLPIGTLSIMSQVAFACGSGFTGLFIEAFLEPSVLPRWLRRTLKGVSVAVMLTACFCALQFDFMQAWGNTVYNLALVPLMPLYLFAIGWALLRRSRAAYFVAAAWLPIVFASLEQAARIVFAYTPPPLVEQSLFIAIGLEVIIVALGVADRFLAVRRERDRAVTEARTMEELAERDSLTGLLNRRAIEAHYEEYRRQGFTALAIIDLDYFKAINDRHGHSMGDRVLRCVATALRPGDDPDTRAFRVGGEEFLLLLRGHDAMGRAEARRRSITQCVAELAVLKERVTASMGFVQAGNGSLADTGFATLYERADRLLYEAKAAGRDRSFSERVRVFDSRPGKQRDRRRAPAPQAAV